MLGLLGPNGAGKSTTFKLLTSQEQPTTGKVFLEGKLHQPYEYTFKSMGICYQDDTMWEKLSAEEILKVFGHLVGVKNIKSESEWLFDKLEMENGDEIDVMVEQTGGCSSPHYDMYTAKLSLYQD